MYYYAYIDSNNICQGTYGFPTQVSLDDYIYLGTTDDQSVIGKRWNATTQQWEEVTNFYYAQVNDKDIVTAVLEFPSEVTDYYYIRINTLDESLVGKWYDRNGDQTFKVAPIHILADHSSDIVNYRDEDKWLSDKIDEKADATSVYTKTEVDALIGSGSGTGTAGADGATFTPSVSAEGVLSWTNNKGLTNPSPVNIKGPKGDTGATGATGPQGPQGEKGDPFTYADFTSAQLAALKGDKGDTGDTGPQGEQGPKGDTGATGAEGPQGPQGIQGPQGVKGDTGAQGPKGDKGDKGDTGPAGSDFNGNLTGGILRLSGTQALYNSGSTVTVGSNSLGMVLAASGPIVANNGIFPQSSGSYALGKTNNRWSNIYLSNNPSVSSDIRTKKNIKEVSIDELVDFVSKLKLVTFEYKDEKGEHIGLIAQDVLQANPKIAEYVLSVDEDGFYGLKTAELVFPLIAAYKKLEERVKALEAK